MTLAARQIPNAGSARPTDARTVHVSQCRSRRPLGLGRSATGEEADFRSGARLTRKGSKKDKGPKEEPKKKPGRLRAAGGLPPDHPLLTGYIIHLPLGRYSNEPGDEAGPEEVAEEQSGKVEQIRTESARVGNGGGDVGNRIVEAVFRDMGGFVRALAREVASRDVTVNAIAPGYHHTAANDTAPQTWLDAVVANTPIGRLGRPDEVGVLTAYVASREAGYLTGQVISPTGGFSYGSFDQVPLQGRAHEREG